jgi:hypothetical protein
MVEITPSQVNRATPTNNSEAAVPILSQKLSVPCMFFCPKLQRFANEAVDKMHTQQECPPPVESLESEARVALSRNKVAQVTTEEFVKGRGQLEKETEKPKGSESKVLEELGKALATSKPSISEQLNELTEMELIVLLSTNKRVKDVIIKLTKDTKASSTSPAFEEAWTTVAARAREPPIRTIEEAQLQEPKSPDPYPHLANLTPAEYLHLISKNKVAQDCFADSCKQALNNFKVLCRANYMAELRAIEQDVKAWLLLRREKYFGKTGVMRSDEDIGIGMSPAARELQNPKDPPLRKVNPNVLEALKETEADAADAGVRLACASKRKLDDSMDTVSGVSSGNGVMTNLVPGEC